MNTVFEKLKLIKESIVNFVNRQLNKFRKHPLPVGLSEFHAWAEDIIKTYELKAIADVDSLKYVMASSILHASSSVATMAKGEMANILRKAAANQIASAVFQEIKAKQNAAQQAAASSQAEATANTQVADVSGQAPK